VRYYAEMLKKDIRGISDEALSLFLKYPWPGNVRELQNLIEYAMNFETGNIISRGLVEKRLLLRQKKCYFTNHFKGKSLEILLKDFEKEIIRSCISKCGFSSSKEHVMQQVCNDLSISRATFYRKVKELDIDLNNEKNLNNEI